MGTEHADTGSTAGVAAARLEHRDRWSGPEKLAMRWRPLQARGRATDDAAAASPDLRLGRPPPSRLPAE